MRLPLAALSLTLTFATAGVGHAESPMTGEAFEAYVTGSTLTYSAQGQVYGREEYLPGRRVRWAVAGGQCHEGVWYPEGDFICFVYREQPEPQCWTFHDEGGRLRALFQNAPGGTELIETDKSTQPLICAGPDVGV